MEKKVILPDMPDIEPYTGPKHVPVHQYSLDGKYIATWKSIAEAGREIGIGGGSIANAAKGVQKTAAGFQWRR